MEIPPDDEPRRGYAWRYHVVMTTASSTETTIRLPRELVAQLAALAREDDRSTAAEARIAITHYIELRKTKSAEESR